MKIQNRIDINNFKANKGFISQYQTLITNVVIPYQFKILNDQVEGAEKSHAVANFKNAARVLSGLDAADGFYGMVFQDSDIAKWIEAVGYSLSFKKDKSLEAVADRMIELVKDAQDEDGYLNTYYTIKDKDKRFTNLLEGHELYCSGHMMEAAVSYYEATGKKTLLDVMLKNVKHIYKHFVLDKNPGVPGHPEIELALLKMYRVTKDPQCLSLCKHFIDQRGQDPDFFYKEAKERNWSVWGSDGKDPYYQQSDRPVRELQNATGHSVRAVYLYTAMADLASETEDKELFDACKRLWESITKRQMYVTGGIGSTVLGEAFTTDYNLPNDTAYSETCAAIGLMFFASRMLENEINGEYADVMERAFYNTVLAGMQLDGKRFFYVNPLEVIPGVSGKIKTHMHTLPTRPKWYSCACCPPNVARTINSIGKYAYGENDTTLYCHMIVDGEVKSQKNGLYISCETDYPFCLSAKYTVLKGSNKLAIHIPGWSKKLNVLHNDNCICNTENKDTMLKNGYLILDVNAGDVINITFDQDVHFIYSSLKVAANTGRICLERGPLVYCLEGFDNEGDILSLSVREDSTARVVYAEDIHLSEDKFKTKESYQKQLSYLANLVELKATILKIDGRKTILSDSTSLYCTQKPIRLPYTLTAVPYFTWGNRGENEMRVWIPENN